MSKESFNAQQRFYLWLTFLIVFGSVSSIVGVTYLVTRH